MSVINHSEFGKLRFNVTKVTPGDSLFEAFPELKHIPGFDREDLVPVPGEGDEGVKLPDYLDQAIRYICLMYDPYTPLRKIYTDVRNRKAAAAELAGVPLDGPIAPRLYYFKDPAFLSMVDNFLRHVTPRTFSLIVVNEESFYEYQSNIMERVSDARDDKTLLQALEVKNKLMDAMDKIHERLERLIRDYYMDDSELEVATGGMTRFTSEAIAQHTRSR